MEYIINSKKYGQKIVLLDEEDYNKIVSQNIKLQLRFDITIKGFYVAFHQNNENGRAKVNGKDVRKTVQLARYIMDCPKGLQVDHINRNTLDNRKCNLRIVTCRENNKNRRNNNEHIGVYFRKNKWQARITINGKDKHLGLFTNLEDAIKARKKAELILIEGGDINALL